MDIITKITQYGDRYYFNYGLQFYLVDVNLIEGQLSNHYPAEFFLVKGMDIDENSNAISFDSIEKVIEYGEL